MKTEAEKEAAKVIQGAVRVRSSSDAVGGIDLEQLGSPEA